MTDPGKKSKKGRLTLEYSDGQYRTVEEGKGDPKKVNPSPRNIQLPLSKECRSSDPQRHVVSPSLIIHAPRPLQTALMLLYIMRYMNNNSSDVSENYNGRKSAVLFLS